MQILNQWAVVTGASTGIGYYYCQVLLARGYHVVGTSRNAQGILKLKKEYPNLQIRAYDLDLSVAENVYKLYDLTKKLNVTVVINNAGVGVWGKFKDTDLDSELNMISLNINALQILTKLYLKRFLKYDYGRIINVSSIAGFQPGPIFSSYYASKAYILNLSTAINYELKKDKSKVRVITICPGPLKTNFRESSKIKKDPKIGKSKFPDESSIDAFAQKSLKKALKTKRKNYILVGFWNKLAIFSSWVLPRKYVLRFIYKYQFSH